MEEQRNVQDLFGYRASLGGVSMAGRRGRLGLSLSEAVNRPSPLDSPTVSSKGSQETSAGQRESSFRSASPRASDEALCDAFQIIKDNSTELRELRRELRESERERIELSWKTRELELTKQEVENLKKERAGLQATLREKDEMTKHLTSEMGKRENSLSAMTSLLESTKKEVESLKKKQTEVSLIVKDQLEVTKGGTREIREDLDHLKQLARNSGGTSGRSLVDLKVYLSGRTPGLDVEYKVMERSVFDITQTGLIWLTSRPVWHFDGVQVSYSRFTALIEDEKVSLDGLRETIAQSHKRVWKCETVSIQKL